MDNTRLFTVICLFSLHLFYLSSYNELTIKFCYKVTDRNITFLLSFHVLHVELWEVSCKSVDFLLTENIKRGILRIIV